MKKLTGLLIAMVLLNTIAFSQEDDAIQKGSFAVHLFFNDFKSAEKLKANSLAIVLKNKEFGKVGDMSPGIAFNYIKGISRHYDFTTSLASSWLDYPMQKKAPSGENSLLLEADVSIRGKLISNDAFIQPYLQLGIGGSKFLGYYGAFVPVGMGLQMNLFKETFFLINAQYRIPVTETTNYHFWFGFGVAGSIDKNKTKK